MQRIVRHHGLQSVPVDLAPDSSTVSLESLERAITARSRVLIVAHLFGVRMNLEPLLEIARRHHLFVVEDCAQAYVGPEYRGHPQCDASLFSFGPIKTATALGGGVMCLRSPELAERIRAIQRSYAVQGRWSYLCRLAKYGLFQTLASRVPLEIIARSCQLTGIDLDALVAGAARNFPAQDLLEHLRRQPSAPLLRMLIRRWCRFDHQRLQQREERGARMAGLLPPQSLLTSVLAERNSYWVFPVLVDDPAAVVRKLRAMGLDATSRSRLSIVTPPAERAEHFPLNTLRTVERLVFLPSYPEIPFRLLQRAVDVLVEHSPPPRPDQLPGRKEAQPRGAPEVSHTSVP
jgi:dTDP-4-amino-4,6-dideoxygalactose transaminase